MAHRLAVQRMAVAGPTETPDREGAAPKSSSRNESGSEIDARVSAGFERLNQENKASPPVQR